MRHVIFQYWIVVIVGFSLLAGCNKQVTSDANQCPPEMRNTKDTLEMGQGWITSISSDTDGNWRIATDLDEYEGDPAAVAEYYEGVRRIGLPDVTIVGLHSTNGWSVGSPIFFSGMTDAGFSGTEHLLKLSPTSIICHPSKPSQRRITLTRPICTMVSDRCYTDGYTIFENGTVLFTERDWGTDKTITKTGQISVYKFEDLVSAFEKVDYFSFQDDYNRYDFSDADSVTTSITLEHTRKSIFHYHGDTTAPSTLTDLERKLEDIVNAIQYK